MLKKLENLKQALHDNKEAFEVLIDTECAKLEFKCPANISCGSYECFVLQLNALIYDLMPALQEPPNDTNT